MTDPGIARAGSRAPAGYGQRPGSRTEPANLADILERVLDKGIVIAGDIRVNLLDIELLTIKLRLLVASVDKAKEMGIDWWEHDPSLSSQQRDLADENRRLRDRLEALEEGRDEDENRRLRERLEALEEGRRDAGAAGRGAGADSASTRDGAREEERRRG